MKIKYSKYVPTWSGNQTVNIWSESHVYAVIRSYVAGIDFGTELEEKNFVVVRTL